jgi:nucleotide-binding universal stress UspA family protein
MKNILIATDGSACARAAVDAGLELAESAGADVTVLYVRRPIEILGEPFYQRKLSRQLEAARSAVDDALKAASERGVPASDEVGEGDPASVILQLAESRDADLVVVGSRGLGQVSGALLGSVSRGVVHGADRPVLVIKDPRPTKVGRPADAEQLRAV